MRHTPNSADPRASVYTVSWTAAVPRLSDDAFRLATVRPIEDAILRRTGNRYERAAFLSEAGRVLFEKGGTRVDVEISDDDLRRFVGRVYLATHNHPRSTSFTDGDILMAIALDVWEVNAFSPAVRYRLRRLPGGRGWPARAVAEAVIRGLNEQIRLAVLPRVARGELPRAEAEALHRHARADLFAQRFAGDVHYVVEERQ
jgi:hypothetical protein